MPSLEELRKTPMFRSVGPDLWDEDMNNWTWHVIVYCLAVWLVYWLVMSLTAKRAIQHRGGIGYRIITTVYRWGLRQEEELMIEHFPEYKQRVRALIPFVL
jgi:hypothetical protein